MKRSPKPITAEPKEANCRRGRSAAGAAALRTRVRLLQEVGADQPGVDRGHHVDPQLQPARPGRRRPTSQPRLTQARAESASAAVSPLSEPRAAQARAKRGSTSKGQAAGGHRGRLSPGPARRRQRRHRDQRQVGEEAGAGRIEGDCRDDHDDRERQHQRPPAAAQAARGRRARGLWAPPPAPPARG